MNLLNMLILLLIVSSCSTMRKKSIIERGADLNIPLHSFNKTTHNDIKPYIKIINNKLKEKGLKPVVNIIINYDTFNFFIDMSKKNKISLAAICLENTLKSNEILINKAIFNTMNSKERLWLIFHEIGHCKYNKKHNYRTDSLMYNQMPTSLNKIDSVINNFIEEITND